MIISKTPLRIGLLGGGTDIDYVYKNLGYGAVVSAAINKYIYVIVKERFDDLIIVHYKQNEIVKNVNDLKHELIRESLKKLDITSGIEIITVSDIFTEGSGLGSSSTVTVGVLNALYTYKGIQATKEELAKDACDIEINILGKPIGKQDQYMAAYGNARQLVFYSSDAIEISDPLIKSHDLDKLDSNLFLHYTNIKRSANDILNNQKDNFEKNKEGLKKIAERAADNEPIKLLKSIDFLGKLIKENWEIKRNFASNTTQDYIDEMVNYALENGAEGCKITGAGGGGFLLSYVPFEKQLKFKEAMNKYHELPFNIDPFGTRIVANFREELRN